MKTRSIVIAIAAISGGGKTTLVHALVKELNAAQLYFDDYPNSFPEDLKKWLKEGSDLNLITSPELAKDLKELKSGNPIKTPQGEIVKPNPIIVIEEPTGRVRTEMYESIDYVVAINTPSEISLARRIKRSLDHLQLKKINKYLKKDIMKTFTETVEGFQGYLDLYTEVGNKFYIEVLKQVEKNCDLVIDWEKTPEEMVEIIKNKFNIAQ